MKILFVGSGKLSYKGSFGLSTLHSFFSSHKSKQCRLSIDNRDAVIFLLAKPAPKIQPCIKLHSRFN